MSLDAALNGAQLSLSSNAKRISVIQRNIAGVSDPDYSRKIAPFVSLHGGVHVAGPFRAGDEGLYERYLEANSSASRAKSVLDGLVHLADTVVDTNSQMSLTVRLGALRDSLRSYANAPAQDALAYGAVSQAQDMARSLKRASDITSEVHHKAATDIASSVERINDLLRDFSEINQQIIRGTAVQADVTDDLDRREAIVKSLSEEIGISVMRRPNNDMVLYTDGGVTLFETTAREVGASIIAGQPARVFVDGVQVAGDAPLMPSNSGRLVGLVKLHNEITVQYAAQLDQLAWGLIQAFREIDPGDATQISAGLFIDSASVGIPAAASGLAQTIAVNPMINPDDPTTFRKLRDGINYDYNPDHPSAAPSFADRLFTLLEQLDAPVANLDDKNPLGYAALSVGWLEGSRKEADQSNKSHAAVLEIAAVSLSNAHGVDKDQELALFLQVENMWRASARLITAINKLYEELFSAVR